MAAGDIILPDGTVIPVSAQQQIAAAVKEMLAAESKDLTQYEEVSSIDNVSSLPGLRVSGSAATLVRVALDVLKGVDGKTPEITADGTAIKWQYQGASEWNTLVQLSLLKGDKGDDGEKVMIRKGGSGIEWKYEDDASWQTLVPLSDLSFTYDELTDEQKQEISKKPVLSAVEATEGETASGQFVADGTDENDNPKYKLVVTLPKGDKGDKGDTGEKGDTGDTGPQGVQGEEGPQGETGKTPVLQKGTIVTLEPTEDATFELIASGMDESGNPIYKLNLGVPKGNPGDGSGNVNVTNGASLETGKQYAFKPSADGSLKGTFTTIPAASSTANGLMSSADKSKLDDMKQVWKVPSAVLGLTDESTSDEIVEAFGMPISNFHVRIASCVDNLQAEYKAYNSMKAFIGNYECLLSGHVTDGQYTIDFNYVDAGTLKTISIIQVPGGPITFACKLSESGGSADDTYWLVSDKIISLQSGAAHEEILEALGGDIEALCNAVIAGKKIFMRYSLSTAINMVIPVSAYALGTATVNIVYIYPDSDLIYEVRCSTSNISLSYVKVLYPGGFKLNNEFALLTQDSDSKAISDAVGGESGMKEIIHAVNDGNRLVVRETTGMNIDLLCFGALEKENGDMQISVSAIGYGLFGGVVSYVIIEYIKSNDLFTITVVNLY